MMRAFFVVLFFFLYTTNIYSQKFVDSVVCNDVKHSFIVNGLVEVYLDNIKYMDIEKLENRKITVKDRITLLNKEFQTSFFSKYCAVRAIDFKIKSNDLTYQLGAIEIKFREKKDWFTAHDIINRKKRNHLSFKLLTHFRVYYTNKGLVFLYTETGRHAALKDIFIR